MKLNSILLKGVLLLSVFIFFLHSGVSAAETDGKTARKTDQKKVETSLTGKKAVGEDKGQAGLISIDFNNVDINVFIKFISELTGENFVVDQKVRGKVTIISPEKITAKEAYKVFESVLEVHGYTTVKAGKVTKIIPSPDARSKNVKILLGKETGEPEDRVVTQLVPLKYADPIEIKRLFAPLVSKNSVVVAYSSTNMLIITDIYSNILRLVQILGAIDIAGVGRELSVIPLEYSAAAEVVKLLSTVFKPLKRRKGSYAGKSAKFVAYERTNTIVLVASEDETSRIKTLVRLLDHETPKGKEGIHVYYLENAVAEDLATVLQEIPVKGKGSGKGAKAPVVSDNVRITADKATNSLIIMAEKGDYDVIEDVIKKLDIPRAMVYIECLIMEVNVDKDFALGTEWMGGGKTDYDGKTGFIGGGFGGAGSPGYSNIFGMVTPNQYGAGSLPAGFSIGAFGETIEIGGVIFPNLAAVIQAYKMDKDVHILSTPQILTTDNEEATITVGKNVPFQTRSAAESGAETYSSYEYKDVGITLKITPQISKGRLVRLNISQEATKLDELSTTSSDRPTTLKRSIETTVIVQDKNTVVIGGLIDDSFTDTKYKVPCLGDVPGLKWLFSTISLSREKTNLFVFLTPRVIKNPMEADEIYKKKKEQIEKIEEGSIKMYKRDTYEKELLKKPDSEETDSDKPGEPDEKASSADT